GSGPIRVGAEVTPDLLREAERWSRSHRETGEAILERGGLGSVFEYAGVPLLDPLRRDLATLFSILNDRQIYVHAFRSLFQRLSPSVVVAYNWEGVFRPLTEAAIQMGVPLVGVQQALGPYGHALDHRVAGYVQPGGAGDGLRIPTKLD